MSQKRISTAFLIEIAIDEYDGLTVRESAARQRCSMGTVQNARKHADYAAIYQDVYRKRFDARVSAPAASGEPCTDAGSP